MNLLVVIPAYNEAFTIGKVVRRTIKIANHVIVIDDGSNDETARIAKSAGAEVIVLKKNMGKAFAIKSGIKDCTEFEVTVIMDGDLQHLPNEIPLLLDEIKRGADICIGSRLLKNNNIMPRMNRISNKIASRLISSLIGKKITDPQSGFRAIKSNKLQLLDLEADRYAIDHIMLLEAGRKKFKIKEIPTSCIYGEEKSNIRPILDPLFVIYQVCRFLTKNL
tara:strand:- start:8697 stop:9359 length:663 start_codon:yes stop_codon:yes gene_type:complete